jgi:Fe-S-cluster containining protein
MMHQIKNNLKAYDYISDKANEILQHYVCPPECNAICCKDGIISFEKKEYFKIIGEIDSTSKAIIEQMSINPSSMQSTNIKLYGKEIARLIEDNSRYAELLSPCPLLNNSGKCNIYSNRPAVCKRYPFEFLHFDLLEDTDNIELIIKMCPLSKDVLLDYGCWLILIHKDEIVNLLQSITYLYREIKAENIYKMFSTALIIDKPMQTLTEWVKYLQNLSPEVKSLQREILLNFIQENGDKPIKETEISEIELKLIQCNGSSE